MSQVGTVYAQALYSLTKDENCSQSVLQELMVLNESFENEPKFLHLLSAPNLSKEERCGILDRSFRGKVHPYVLNFLKILTEKGYSKHFFDCVAAYREHYNRDNGILPVTAITAVALTAQQSEKLTDKLSRTTGKQVKLLNKVDPTILGGVRLDYDGKRLDDTVSHRLDAIRTLLKDTVL
jgi:F-type H+-transporting ATPase subunit delta